MSSGVLKRITLLRGGEKDLRQVALNSVSRKIWNLKLGLVVHICNPSTEETEAGGS
jgi:hypothetical protein